MKDNQVVPAYRKRLFFLSCTLALLHSLPVHFSSAMHTNIHALLSLACFALVFNALYVSGIGPQPQSLSLNCGSENGGTDGDGRKWESDVKYITGKYPHARA